jgi:nitroreductase
MTRQSPHPKVHQLFVDRWSPRSFDESAIPQEDLEAIFAAAGLAPSAFNYQPWKFLYARRGDANWERFLSLLIPFNASWAKDAAVLVFIVSDTKMRKGEEAKDHYSHSFDAGAAWAQMALQATLLGYNAHGMTGIDFGKARQELDLPDDIRLEAAVAIGRRDRPDRLPDGLREREAPSGRKAVDEIAIAGNYR